MFKLFLVLIIIAIALAGYNYQLIGAPVEISLNSVMSNGGLITGGFLEGLTHGFLMLFSTVISFLDADKTPFLYYQTGDYNLGLALGSCLSLSFVFLLFVFSIFKK